MIAVLLNVGGGVRLIKPANLYMCTQTHYKHDEDGRAAPGVRGHGYVSLSHSGNVVIRIGLHKHSFALQLSLGSEASLMIGFSSLSVLTFRILNIKAYVPRTGIDSDLQNILFHTKIH